MVETADVVVDKYTRHFKDQLCVSAVRYGLLAGWWKSSPVHINEQSNIGKSEKVPNPDTRV